MPITVPARSAAFVESLIASGEYGSAQEVVSAALLAFERRQAESVLAQLEPALDRLDRDEGLTVDRAGLHALRDQIQGGTRELA